MKYIILNQDGYNGILYGQEIELLDDEVNIAIANGAILGVRPKSLTKQDISNLIGVRHNFT